MFADFNIRLFLSIFLLAATMVYAQEPGITSLRDRVAENKGLWETDADKAFSDTAILLEEAIRTGDYDSELELLNRRCWYYNYTTNVDKLIRSAQVLQKKAIKYKNRPYQAKAHTYLIAAYATSELYDKGISEFDKAMAILEKEDGTDPDIIRSKTRAYGYLANLFNHKKEYEKALQLLFSISKEFEKFENSGQKRESQFSNYSHIAVCYRNIDIDSSEYYVKKSMSLKPEFTPQNKQVVFINYSLLGDIQRVRKNYKEALAYYHKAEELILEGSSSSNIENYHMLFEGVAEAYEALSDTVNANLYRLKSKETKLEVAQNKNKSLRKILEDTPEENNTKTYITAFISLLLISGLVFFIYRLKRKNKLLQEQERKSEEYLKAQETIIINNNREQLYKDLVEMVEKNDPGFMNEFLKAFPYFSEKLRSINPAIRDVDIELCAFLKLNLPTKEIARWKNLAPRTIHNSKYQIRKRLNIPDNMDIYYWFSQF